MRNNAAIVAIPAALISALHTPHLRAESATGAGGLAFEVASVKPNRSDEGLTNIRFPSNGRFTAINVSLMAGAQDAQLAPQSPAAATELAFEVASIRMNKSGDLRTTMAFQPGGRFTATNASLGALIRNAYQRSNFAISGLPNWAESDRFDVAAKAEGDPSPAEMRLMLRSLLADRFNLQAQHETRELPIYELEMARNARRPGPQLRRTEADCTRAPAPPPPPYPNGAPACGFIGPNPGLAMTQAAMAFRGLTMEAFARFLAPALRRYVVDRTGLTGYFDGDFDFSAEFGPPPPPPGVPNPFEGQAFPSMFSVLPERLGLKLESARGPVDVLVIDGVERPTED